MAGPSLLTQNSQQQQRPTPKNSRPKPLKIKKKRVTQDEFAATWCPRFAQLDIDLEDAREAKSHGGLKIGETEEGEGIFDGDGDDDYHLRQLDVVEKGLTLVEEFEKAAMGVTVGRRSFVGWQYNPFAAADALKKFVIDFLEMWQTIKHENFYHNMPRHGLFIKQFAKKLNALLERAARMAPGKIHKIRGAGGGRPRKRKVEDEGEGEDE